MVVPQNLGLDCEWGQEVEESIRFQINEESVKSAQVTALFGSVQMNGMRKGRMLIIGDSLTAHRSKVVAQYLAVQKGRRMANC